MKNLVRFPGSGFRSTESRKIHCELHFSVPAGLNEWKNPTNRQNYLGREDSHSTNVLLPYCFQNRRRREASRCGGVKLSTQFFLDTFLSDHQSKGIFHRNHEALSCSFFLPSRGTSCSTKRKPPRKQASHPRQRRQRQEGCQLSTRKF